MKIGMVRRVNVYINILYIYINMIIFGDVCGIYIEAVACELT